MFERLKNNRDDIGGRKALIRASGLKRGKVLDIGIGACGCMSFFLARRGFHVTGVDSSEKAVHATNEYARKRRFRRNFEGRLANAEHFSFQNGEFDAVIAYHSMHHVDHVENVTEEMFRVCRNGGLVLVADLNERGKRRYEHSHNAGALLLRVEELLEKHTKAIQKILTRYDVMFVCRKTG